MKLVAYKAEPNSICSYELTSKERIVWLGKQPYRDLLAEGEIFEVDVTKEWVFGHTHFITGEITNHVIDIPALGLEPLPVHSYIPESGEFEMEQVIPGIDEDFSNDPICNSVDLKDIGEIDKAFKVLYEVLKKDLRCIDAHVHLGHLRFKGTTLVPYLKLALRNYQVGVAMGDYFLGPNFSGILSWYEVDNRPYLRALQSECLALWSLDRFEEAWNVSQRWVRYCPQDNLDMGYIGSIIQKKVNYQEYLKKEEDSLGADFSLNDFVVEY